MVPYERIECVRSANVLFHFMKKKKYRKRLVFG